MEESRIKLILSDEGNIIIYNNDELMLTIVADTKMQIKADEIFESLKYDPNKTYVLEDVLENKKETLKRRYEAMVKLHGFYEELVKGINKIDIEDSLTVDINLDEEDI